MPADNPEKSLGNQSKHDVLCILRQSSMVCNIKGGICKKTPLATNVRFLRKEKIVSIIHTFLSRILASRTFA